MLHLEGKQELTITGTRKDGHKKESLGKERKARTKLAEKGEYEYEDKDEDEDEDEEERDRHRRNDIMERLNSIEEKITSVLTVVGTLADQCGGSGRPPSTSCSETGPRPRHRGLDHMQKSMTAT